MRINYLNLRKEQKRVDLKFSLISEIEYAQLDEQQTNGNVEKIQLLKNIKVRISHLGNILKYASIAEDKS